MARTPPAPYDRDPGFGASVAEVTAVYAKAQAQAKTNQLHDAHNTLERARDVMAELRQRNQVVVYSDHMNAYHTEMEKILIDGNATLAKPNGMLQMTAQTGALSYLTKRLETQAPTELTNNQEFTSLLNAVQLSVRHLESALLNQDKAAVTEAIGKLKGPYSKLFSKFG